MREYYQLTYATDAGKTKFVRVDGPDRSLNETAILSAADKILNADIFDLENNASLESLEKVEIYKITRNVLVKVSA